MIRFLYPLYFLCLVAGLQAQPYGIIDLTIQPEIPVTQDSVRARVQLTFSTQQTLIAVTDSVVGNTVYLDLHYCGGLLPSIDVRSDTFNLGLLPEDDYKLVCTVFEYGPEWDEDGMIIDTCKIFTTYQDSVLFKVDLLNRIKPLRPREYNFSPNPASSFIKIESQINLRSIQLRTITGNVILVWNGLNTSSQYFQLPAVPKGVYLLQIEFSDYRSVWEKLVIK